MPKVDLYGRRFGRYLVISLAEGRRWVCQCECGSVRKVASSNLLSGHSRSCGCLARETARKAGTTHGGSASPLYVRWQRMLDRCRNPNNIRYHRYGGRGISVCDRWLSFENFRSDMGPPPTKNHQLDRIDNDKGYSLDNCRWATVSENCLNKEATPFLDLGPEEQLPVSWWANLMGIPLKTLKKRLKMGWSPLKAVTTPVRK